MQVLLVDTDLNLLDIPTYYTVLGLLSDNSEPQSPSRDLRDSDSQWLSSEVADFSLSSFLGHLESPVKPAPAPSTTGDESRLSQDVCELILHDARKK